MQTIRLENPGALQQVIHALREGGVVVYPTETCYGLGCDIANFDAVQRIFAIKQRDVNKSMLVIAHDISVCARYVDWTHTLENIAERYWPGPLTVVTKLKEGVCLPDGVVGADRSIAFRVTSHPVAYELARGIDNFLVSTSANLSAGENPYEFGDVMRAFRDAPHTPDIVIDSGVLPYRTPSTIIRVHTDGSFEVLRQGEIIVSDLQ